MSFNILKAVFLWFLLDFIPNRFKLLNTLFKILLNVKISKESLRKYWIKFPKALISLIYFLSSSKTIDLEVETTVYDSSKSINIAT